MTQELRIRRLLPPRTKDLDSDIEWICESLGLITSNDKDDPTLKIFREVLFSLARNSKIRSDELAEKCNLTRGAVNYHIRYLINSGIFVRRKRCIMLRSGNLRRTLEDIQRDVNFIFEEMKRIAKEIDKELGLEYR